MQENTELESITVVKTEKKREKTEKIRHFETLMPEADPLQVSF